MTSAVTAAYWIAAVGFLAGLGITAALYAKRRGVDVGDAARDAADQVDG